MKDLHFFISCKEQVVNIELFHTQYDIAYQLSLFIQTQANTPFGLVAGSESSNQSDYVICTMSA